MYLNCQPVTVVRPKMAFEGAITDEDPIWKVERGDPLLPNHLSQGSHEEIIVSIVSLQSGGIIASVGERYVHEGADYEIRRIVERDDLSPPAWEFVLEPIAENA